MYLSLVPGVRCSINQLRSGLHSVTVHFSYEAVASTLAVYGSSDAMKTAPSEFESESLKANGLTG
jgi:hypothetical protein